ncbi:Protein ea47 [Vibrio coralliirubri]|uniref:hypothetical protein n=1 Tax=Vibrio coralliirubri TaxID=1516159 RepID=UPI00062F9620|nr:hypothetical protein [Vibrio coralliirubri]CDT81441.1 Protein ea47 [Vibrio coralliirubri]
MNKKPWERRLKDLAHLLNACATTYFDPELFRLNLNQFLQTSRTVTFIIQKNKRDINGYEGWYPVNVVEKWQGDHLMTWAKNSRNTIEKQGDLEMYSSAKATLLFSYIEEQDVEITTREELLGVSVKRLVRLAQKRLPSGITDAAVIKAERRWVANSLKDYELLHALSLIYARVYDCCKSLGELVGNPIDQAITKPALFDSMREEMRHVNYLKIKNFAKGKLSHTSVSYDSESIPEVIKERAKSVGAAQAIDSIESLVDFYSQMAEVTFQTDGYHIPILMFFDRSYKVIDLLSTRFDDQADKYIFWRFAADRAQVMNAYGFVWISELWVRSTKVGSSKAIHQMPIVEEKLQVIGINAINAQKGVSWKVVRENEEVMATLSSPEVDDPNEGQAFFMRPVLKALGGDVSRLNN